MISTVIARSPRAGYYANLQLRGSCRTVQDGRAAVTQPGDLTVVNTERPFAFELSDDFAQLSFYVPGQLLHRPGLLPQVVLHLVGQVIADPQEGHGRDGQRDRGHRARHGQGEAASQRHAAARST